MLNLWVTGNGMQFLYEERVDLLSSVLVIMHFSILIQHQYLISYTFL